MHRVKCRFCKVDFVALRSDAKCCGPTCRQAARREANKLEAEIEAVWERRRAAAREEPLPERNLVCRECGIERYDGQKCDVCNSDQFIKLL